MTAEEEQPRILVEGGPVHRKLQHTIAFLAGFALAVLGILGYLIAANAHSISEIKATRHNVLVRNCQEANERHDRAIEGLEAFVGAQRHRPLGPLRLNRLRVQLGAFVTALDPFYNCVLRVHEQEVMPGKEKPKPPPGRPGRVGPRARSAPSA